MPRKGEFKANASKDSVRQRRYNGSATQKKRRAERNASRAKMVKSGRAHKGDGKDVDHRNHRTSDKSGKNLRMMSRSANRAKNLGTGGRKPKRK